MTREQFAELIARCPCNDIYGCPQCEGLAAWLFVPNVVIDEVLDEEGQPEVAAA